MSATRTRSRNGGKPESESKPESAQALDLAAAVASESVTKPQRVYVDVPDVPRPPTADGTLATVQREQRADGSLGEYMLTEIRTNKDKSESAQRYSIARVQALKDALASVGVQVLR